MEEELDELTAEQVSKDKLMILADFTKRFLRGNQTFELFFACRRSSPLSVNKAGYPYLGRQAFCPGENLNYYSTVSFYFQIPKNFDQSFGLSEHGST